MSWWGANPLQSTPPHICRAYHHYHTEMTIIRALLYAPKVPLLLHITKVITSWRRAIASQVCTRATGLPWDSAPSPGSCTCPGGQRWPGLGSGGGHSVSVR